MLEAISRRMRNENLTNVKTVLGTVSDPRLPVGIDAILISDAFHEMDEPADPMLVVRLLKNAAESLKPRGGLGEGGGPGGSDARRAAAEERRGIAEAAGSARRGGLDARRRRPRSRGESARE